MAPDVWRNFINKPRLNNTIANIAEVGFSHYGPTFSIAGTLSALNSVVLIHNICANIIPKNGKAAHYMDWFAFRPANYVMGNFSGMDLVMASKFTVAPNHPQDHNTLFIDNNRFSEMKPILTAIKESWKDALMAAAKTGNTINSSTLFTEFKNLKMIADASERLKTMNYWEPGQYNVSIRVTTDSPKQIFDEVRTFILKDTDAQKLSNNVPAIIANICQQPQATYSCSTPALTMKA